MEQKTYLGKTAGGWVRDAAVRGNEVFAYSKNGALLELGRAQNGSRKYLAIFDQSNCKHVALPLTKKASGKFEYLCSICAE